MNILHVAAHYGGGVGSVVRSWVTHDAQNMHTLSYLVDKPLNISEDSCLFSMDMIPNYDIVVVHVWNHPKLFRFLVSYDIPPCRMIGWLHMAGTKAPYIAFDKLKNFFDDFYYTSPISGEDHDFIWSSCDIRKFSEVEKKAHKGFNIGYIGTLDYSKLHRNFISICSKINLPDVRFTIVGGGCDLENMIKEAESFGLSERFTFAGQVKNIIPYLERMDVFLYPLCKSHQGTCEQIIGEVMASGITCVALNNKAESCIIANDITGYLCDTEREMIQTVYDIYHKSPQALDMLNSTAQEYAMHLYDVKRTINLWNKAFSTIIERPKKLHIWGKYDHLFLESLGPYAEQFLKSPQILIKENYHHWNSKSKGSPRQYLSFFPHDKNLQEWVKLL